MLQASFYARFHPERGPSIIHQYPATSIITPASSPDEGLLSFSRISSYVIPPYELCNRPLSICTNGFCVLGFPISLEDPKYERNRFTFNVCFVLKETDNTSFWSKAVSKTACFFKAVEEEDGLLQSEEDLPELKWAGENGYPAHDTGIIFKLLEAIFEDLNTYGEACARIDDHHVLNLALSQSRPKAPKLQAWDVPLFIRALPSLDEWTWDLTLQRIHPHIDGVNYIGRIAQLADVELKLVKKAVRELLYHDRVMMLDIFHFQAIYALKSDFTWFVQDEEMQHECAKYVARDRDGFDSAATQPTDVNDENKQSLVQLYRDLHPGTSVHDFYFSHQRELSNIDIRRFITYGVIKGFLCRIHKYAIAIESHQTPPRLNISNGSAHSRQKSTVDVERDLDRAWKKAAFSSGWANPPTEPISDDTGKSQLESEGVEVDVQEEEQLRSYLDGSHCMDEICVALKLSEKKAVEKLRSGRYGNVVFFTK